MNSLLLEFEWGSVALTSGMSWAFSMRTILTVSPPHWVSVSPWVGSDSGCISLSAMLSWARSKDCNTHTHTVTHRDRHYRILLYMCRYRFVCVCVSLPGCVFLTAGCGVRVPLCSDFAGWDSWPETMASQHIVGNITRNINIAIKYYQSSSCRHFWTSHIFQWVIICVIIFYCC